MVGRRGFLGILDGLVMDPERLLWVPGKKLISIPAVVPVPSLFFEETPILAAIRMRASWAMNGGTYIHEPFLYGNNRSWDA
jgi:hypothetical protein